jgi:hypothetical protein
MPSIDDLLDAEAGRWRAEVDARFAATTFTIEPAVRRLSRRYAWTLAAVGAAAAATAIVLAATSGPSDDGTPVAVGPAPTHSAVQLPPSSGAPQSTRASQSIGVGSSGSCAGPLLSFRDPYRRQHLRVTPTLARPVHPGGSVRVYGVFFLATCHDTGQGGPERPVRSVRLVLHASSGGHQVISVVHPHGQLGRFRVHIRIPDDAPTGRSAITDGYGYGGLRLRIAD